MAETKIRDPEILSAEIDRFPLDTFKGLSDLKAHIRATWTIREIQLFKNFTHGGTFYGGEDDDGRFRFRINYAGHIVSTAREQHNLDDLFEGLMHEAWAFIGAKSYQKLAEECAHPVLLLFKADGGKDSPFDMTLAALVRSLPKGNALAQMFKILTNLQQGQADIKADTKFLAAKRKDQIEANRKRGAENQAKGNDEERERAAADMENAVKRVRRRVTEKEADGEKVYLLAVCRAVCKKFRPKSSRKNERGDCADGYDPLTGANGKAIKPETLAKNYRERYGKKKTVAAK